MTTEGQSGDYSAEAVSSDAIGSVIANKSPRGHIPKSVDKLDELVEPPLLEACKELYDLGVQTTESSANAEDVSRGYASIVINYDTLSDENKKVVKDVIAEDEQNPDSEKRLVVVDHGDGYKAVALRVPVQENTPVSDVSSRAQEVAKLFRSQPMSWAPRYSLAQVRDMYVYPDDIELDPVHVASETGLVLGGDGYFYLSDDHAQRAA